MPRQFLDLAYADFSERNRLDLFLPDLENPPLLVMIHGGAWRKGDKRMGRLFLPLLQRAGFAVAMLNYRLTPEAIWPAQIEDLRAAFAFLRSAGDTYGYNSTRIASFGPSAGGHLSACCGIDFAEDPATRLAACVCWFPPIDFTLMDADMAASGVIPDRPPANSPDSAESELIGAPVGENPELAQTASPLTRLAELPPGTPLPPFLIMHGAQDQLIGAGQSERLAEALRAFNTAPAVELQILPGGTHGGGEFNHPRARFQVMNFLRNAFALASGPAAVAEHRHP